MLDSLRRVAIIGSARTAFARSNTAYLDLGNIEMLTAAMRALVNKYDLRGEILDEVPQAPLSSIRATGTSRVRLRSAADWIRTHRLTMCSALAAQASPRSSKLRTVSLSVKWAKCRKLPIQAYLTQSAVAAMDFAGLSGPREGLLMAPTFAVPKMLDRAANQHTSKRLRLNMPLICVWEAKRTRRPMELDPVLLSRIQFAFVIALARRFMLA